MAEPSIPHPRYLTRQEAAYEARCTRRTIQRWQEQGRLRRCGVGRPLIDRDELQQVLAGNADDTSVTEANEQTTSATHKGPKTPVSGQLD